MKKQGPTRCEMPSVKYNTCLGCEHLNRYMHRSGRNPIYSNNCTHGYDNAVKTSYPSQMNHRFISNETPPITPHWCPFLKEATT